MSLKVQIQEDMKNAMREKNAQKLGAIRLLTAAMKQKEVDERIELDDAMVVVISQYEAAGRQDLSDQEKFEMTVLQAYMPAQLSDSEIAAEIAAAKATTGASGPQDMGKMMALLKPKLAGKADMSAVSALIKKALAG